MQTAASSATSPAATGLALGDPSRSLSEFADAIGRSFHARTQPLTDWLGNACARGTFPYFRQNTTQPGALGNVLTWEGVQYSGINLASRDYLGLAGDPRVLEAAIAASRAFGIHSCGTETTGGGFSAASELLARVCTLTQHPFGMLFASGWAAGYGSIRGMVRPHDHVIIDAHAHNSLQHGAGASTPNVRSFVHNNASSLELQLLATRLADPDAAVLVVTESLFSADSDSPDLATLLRLCRQHGAAMLVSVSNDLGVLGPYGRGALDEQGVLEQVDFIVGSFAGAFASSGGFFTSTSQGPVLYARAFSGAYTFANFLSPPQVGAISEAMQIAFSAEGEVLRQKALGNASILRSEMVRLGTDVAGRLSPIVLPVVGDEEVARAAYRNCLQGGLLLNCLEYPACRQGAARLSMQVLPQHTEQQLHAAARICVEAIDRARTLRAAFSPREWATGSAPFTRAASASTD